jgi:pSer/pThr/pTyr-binding forkhead associated (FHA) protein
MGGSAAETPASPGEQPLPGLRASDAEREQVVSRLRDEFVAGRLSHETFLHRMHVVLESRRQADLPPVLADLPVQPAPRSLAGWLRGAWSRVTGGSATGPDAIAAAQGHRAGTRTAAPSRTPGRALTTSMRAASDRHQPIPLQFPRGGGDQFSIGRDASCDLAIPDMTVSRRHAQLERTKDGWLIADLESTNGTRVNGWRVRGKVPVRAGDVVSFGNLETVFWRDDDPVPVQGGDPPTPSGHGGGLTPV